VTVTNRQPVAITIAIALDGGYTQENDCGDRLKAGASCTITVNPQPDTLRAAGRLKITTPTGTTTVPISGSSFR
jgi:hypothetical protein